jgi:molybdenum cofactor cytidylyltransferase
VRLAGLLLAAGASTRMGSPKQLALLDGQPLVARSARVLLESPCDEVFVAVGASARRVAEALDGLAVRIVEIPGWREGLATSIAGGIAKIEAERPPFDGALLLHADQARVESEALGALVAAFESDGSMAAARYANTLGVPAVFARRHFAALRSLSGDRGAKELLSSSRDVACVDLPEAAFDIDTPDDLRSPG